MASSVIKPAHFSTKKMHTILVAVLPIFLLVFLGSCASDTTQSALISTENSNENSTSEDLKNIGNGTQNYTYVPTEKSTPSFLNQLSSKYFNDISTNTSENTTVVHHKINETTIDSLNSIRPIYDALDYDEMAISFFTTLSEGLNGKTFFANNADSVVASIMQIITSRVNDGTDIVFVIDKTYSMLDDIDKVKKSLGTIMDYLSTFSNVKLGVATYGDKNYHYNFWYDRVELTTDITTIRNYVNKITVIPNPDTPESVNDAIIKTVQETNWTPGNQRMMLVIGDAPSQEPPLSDYSTEFVVKKCNEMNVKFNLYPIVIAVDGHAKPQVENTVSPLLTNVYPNPVVSNCRVEMNQQGDYLIEVIDEGGRVVLNKEERSAKASNLDFGQVPNGKYFVKVLSEKNNTYTASIVIVQR